MEKLRWAKQIEAGQQEIAAAVFPLPLTLTYIHQLTEQIKREEISVRDMVQTREASDSEVDNRPEAFQDSGESLSLAVEKLEKLCQLGKSFISLKERQVQEDAEPLSNTEETQIRRLKKDIQKTVLSINWHPSFLSQIENRLKALESELKMARQMASRHGNTVPDEKFTIPASMPGGKDEKEPEQWQDLSRFAEEAMRRIRYAEREVIFMPLQEFLRAVQRFDQGQRENGKGQSHPL